MKVIQINSVSKSGSVGKIATLIDKMLIEESNQASIAYGRGDAPLDIQSYKFSNKIEVYSHVILNRITDRHGLYSKRATMRLIKYLEDEKPDIIHLHGIHGYYLNYVVLFDYLKQINIPVVWTLHDCWPITGHCAFFDLVDCNKWKLQCHDCPNKREYPASLILDNSISNYKKKKESFSNVEKLVIVTPSLWLKNIIRDSFLGEYDVRVINNGIDTDTFNPNISINDAINTYKKYLDSSYTNKRIVLGVANIWSKRKGLDDFIKLNELLNDKYLIFLVGLTSKQIQNLPKGIVGITRTDSAQELAKLYRGAFCFLNLTYEDNYPTVNIEALSCGTPVITYDTGGSGESVKDKKCVVPKGDLGMIKDLLEHHNFVVENDYKSYDSKFKFKDYITLYKEMLICDGEVYE